MNNPSVSGFCVLLVDDEVETVKSWELSLYGAGIESVLTCTDSSKVLDILATHEIGAVVLDLVMPKISGKDLIGFIQAKFPEVPVIVSSGLNDIETVVNCMKAGATDYFVKPVEENRLIASVRSSLEIRELRVENRRIGEKLLSNELEHPEAFEGILTQCPTMLGVFQYLEATAQSPRSIMLLGETGTGKELLARAVHKLSNRPGKFVGINVAGLDDQVFSDTLFGHVPGAFTGADKRRTGLVQRAAKGTLFLDEIGDLDHPAQIKLLRLLQEREYYPIGADVPSLCEARIVVATNHDLESKVEAGQFRRDLYFRLRNHPVKIPPLRERKEDIPILLEHFLEAASSSLGKRKPSPHKALEQRLIMYEFPGNIRELEAMVYDAVSAHRSGVMSLKPFEDAIGNPSSPPPTTDTSVERSPFFGSISNLPTLKQAAEALVREAMARAGGNQSIAAKFLGITQPSLSRRLKSLDPG